MNTHVYKYVDIMSFRFLLIGVNMDPVIYILLCSYCVYNPSDMCYKLGWWIMQVLRSHYRRRSVIEGKMCLAYIYIHATHIRNVYVFTLSACPCISVYTHHYYIYMRLYRFLYLYLSIYLSVYVFI